MRNKRRKITENKHNKYKLEDKLISNEDDTQNGQTEEENTRSYEELNTERSLQCHALLPITSCGLNVPSSIKSLKIQQNTRVVVSQGSS